MMTDYNDLIERLCNTLNWMKESYGHWKDLHTSYDRAPFEVADAIEALIAEQADILNKVIVQLDSARSAVLNDIAMFRQLQQSLEELVTLKAKIASAKPVAWMFEYDGMIHNKFNPPVFSLARKSTQEPWNETPLYTLEGIKE